MMRSQTYFDFTGIFPSCVQEYNAAEKNSNTSVILNPFNNICVGIKSQLGITGAYFVWTCSVLSNYLETIKVKSNEDDIKRSCKYFNYRLKNELKKINHSCSGERDCYENMITVYNKKNKKGLDKCRNHVENLDEVIFSKLGNLNWLYNNLGNFETDSHKCPSSRTYFNKYLDIYKTCHANDNTSFCEVLKKFKEEHMNSKKDENTCTLVPRILHQANKGGMRKVILTVTLLTFTVLIIIFILYMYTPYGSYVKPCIMKLKNMWNIKNKEQPFLVDSVEGAYKNMIGKNYLISYKSREY
ncbi:variable surface protein [Plasmodium gonderi]|uniref:Variable surface protein n=1 Tax=Plasmodium gonderi TaxID=77519 RepID=A0A1Y1JSB1_PLAGO|nr:variable surface protein [Plasmodium gonderi]GAW84338.1 variable surface protein [Plasmodium gonderi]